MKKVIRSILLLGIFFLISTKQVSALTCNRIVIKVLSNENPVKNAKVILYMEKTDGTTEEKGPKFTNGNGQVSWDWWDQMPPGKDYTGTSIYVRVLKDAESKILYLDSSCAGIVRLNTQTTPTPSPNGQVTDTPTPPDDENNGGGGENLDTSMLCSINGTSGVETGLGCIPFDTQGLVNWFFGNFISVIGGIALLIMLYGAFQIITSGGNPEKVKTGKAFITSAISGLLFAILSLFLMRLLGVELFGLPGLQ